MFELIASLASQLRHTNLSALAVGTSAMIFLWWSRSALQAHLLSIGLSSNTAALLTKLAPMSAIILATLASGQFNLTLATVGQVPAGLPMPHLPSVDWNLLRELLAPAILISLVGFVESVSVGHTLAAKRRQKIQPTASCWVWARRIWPADSAADFR